MERETEGMGGVWKEGEHGGDAPRPEPRGHWKAHDTERHL